MLTRRIEYFVIILMILIVYGQSIEFEFLFDDEHFVEKNQYMTSFSYLPQLLFENIVAGAGMKSNLYRPLQSLTHFIDWQLWGKSPGLHHLTNILIHCGLGLSFYHLFLTLHQRKTALFITLLFVLHPLQHQAVAFISGRGDLLGMIFLCLGLIFYRSYWSLCFFILAMFSKESMALFPLYLFVYERIKKEKFNFKRFTVFSSVAGIYMVLRLTVLNFNNTMNFYNSTNIFTENFSYRLLTFFTSFAKGLSLWFLPYDLHHERHWMVYTELANLQVLLGILLVLIMIAGVFYAFYKKSWWMLGCAWFLIAVFPTSNLLVIINALFYDHWYILPGFGLMFIFAHWYAKLPERYQLPTMLIIILPLSITTFSYTGVWKNAFTLYGHILKHAPNSSKAMVNLAIAYTDKNNDDVAEGLYLKALELDPKRHEIHHNLGMIYFRKRQYQKASGYYTQALDLSPGFFRAKKFLAICYYYLGQKELAIDLLKQVKKEFPLDPDIDQLLIRLK